MLRRGSHSARPQGPPDFAGLAAGALSEGVGRRHGGQREKGVSGGDASVLSPGLGLLALAPTPSPCWGAGSRLALGDVRLARRPRAAVIPLP